MRKINLNINKYFYHIRMQHGGMITYSLRIKWKWISCQEPPQNKILTLRYFIEHLIFWFLTYIRWQQKKIKIRGNINKSVTTLITTNGSNMSMKPVRFLKENLMPNARKLKSLILNSKKTNFDLFLLNFVIINNPI